MAQDQVGKKTYVLINRNTYRLTLIVNIYLLNTTNAFILDSLSLFPTGWLLAGFIAVIIETSSNILYTYLLSLFGWRRNDTTL